MAVIPIDSSVTWSGARWILSNILEHMIRDESMTPAIRAEASRALQMNVSQLDITSWPHADKAMLGRSVDRLLRSVISAGPREMGSPEFYDGYVAKLSGLLSLLPTDD
jgi:hypothetical protein